MDMPKDEIQFIIDAINSKYVSEIKKIELSFDSKRKELIQKMNPRPEDTLKKMEDFQKKQKNLFNEQNIQLVNLISKYNNVVCTLQQLLGNPELWGSELEEQ
jgi:hypothetical protein